MPRPLALVPLLALAAAAAAGCRDDGGSEEAFCATARGFATDNPATVFDEYDPEDPAAAVELLRQEAERLRGWADDAPGDLDDDVEVIAEAAEALADAFEDPDLSPGGTEELTARFTAVEEASARVTAYARERCGVDLDPAATTAGEPAPPDSAGG